MRGIVNWAVVYVVALAIAAALAVPILSFLFVIFSFGLGYLAVVAIGLVALLGPLLLLRRAGWVRFRDGIWRMPWTPLNLWLCALIVHTGASYGQSRWGDVGSTMGAKNMPYAEAFLSPLIFIAQLFNIPLLRTAEWTVIAMAHRNAA